MTPIKPAKQQYVPAYHQGHYDYPLPVHQVVTPYPWYQQTGTCELTEAAYGQCVDWKSSPIYPEEKVEKKEKKEYKKEEPKVQKYQVTVAKINPKSGQAYLDRQYKTAPYTGGYGYKAKVEIDTDNIYLGTSRLPVEITDAYGRKRVGEKVVKDNLNDTKDVTIFDEATGKSNTLTLKDSQRVTHIQEIDDQPDYEYDEYGYAVDAYLPDTQLVTICDDDTYQCDVVALDLNYADDEYVEHAQEEIEETLDALDYEPASEPILIDPLSVGADEDDVCWLEDIIVGMDDYGNEIVESEIFCVDGDDVYAEPVDVEEEDPYGYDALAAPYFSDDYLDDYSSLSYDMPAPSMTGFATAPKSKPAESE